MSRLICEKCEKELDPKTIVATNVYNCQKCGLVEAIQSEYASTGEINKEALPKYYLNEEQTVFLNLSEETKYHKSRLMFAVINDNLHLVDNDERSHKEWLEQDFGLNQNHFKDINRGCIKDSIIMVYKGQNFTSISENELSKIIIMVAHKLELDLTKYTVYNGVKVGAIGETWGAIKVHSGSEFL